MVQHIKHSLLVFYTRFRAWSCTQNVGSVRIAVKCMQKKHSKKAKKCIKTHKNVQSDKTFVHL